ncbi:HNH endonuclease signature motif containing protein [Janibacter corallicola]|uniref:HNH endonuclease signature motif containing protein n=1 Tax=Janibacter corallicola TaxID=415212 RepID=UPI000B1288A9|nr:HNH endonuclease signature motif containing protein [Janibacter corallicola]
MTVTDIDTGAPGAGSTRQEGDEGGPPAPETTRGPLAIAKGLFRDTREDALTDAVALDDAGLEEMLVATEAARRSADALELALVAEVGRRGEERGPDGFYRDVRLEAGRVAEMAPDTVALAIGVRPNEATRRCELAARAATDLADVATLMAEGQVCRRALEQVHRHTRDTDPGTTAAIVAHLLAERRGRPGSTRIAEMEPHEVAKTCRRLVTRLEPELIRQRAEANRRERLDVRTEPGAIGTSELSATLPTEIGAALKSAVDEAARLRRETDPDLPVGTARALGLADLALRGVEVRAEVRLGIPVIASAASRLTFAPAGGDECRCHGRSSPTSRIVFGSRADAVEVLAEEWLPGVTSQALGLLGPEGPAAWMSGTMIPGVGFVPPDVVAAITSRLDTRVSRALLDARTGTLLETRSPRYAVPTAQRDFVAARDGTCRMWGCDRPVHTTRLGWKADVDHATPWPAGETSPANLSALCRHHHRVKHSGRWSHRLAEDGRTEWVTPGGTVAFTFPVHSVADDGGGGAPPSSPPVGTNASSPLVGTTAGSLPEEPPF